MGALLLLLPLATAEAKAPRGAECMMMDSRPRMVLVLPVPARQGGGESVRGCAIAVDRASVGFSRRAQQGESKAGCRVARMHSIMGWRKRGGSHSTGPILNVVPALHAAAASQPLNSAHLGGPGSGPPVSHPAHPSLPPSADQRQQMHWRFSYQAHTLGDPAAQAL